MLKKINNKILFIALFFVGKVYGDLASKVENILHVDINIKTANVATEIAADLVLAKMHQMTEQIETLYLEQKNFDKDIFNEIRDCLTSLTSLVCTHFEKKGHDAIFCANTAKATILQLASLLAPCAKGQIRHEVFGLCCELQKAFGWDVKFRQKFLKTMDSQHFWSKAKHCESLVLRYVKIIGAAVVVLKLVDFIKKAGKTSGNEKDERISALEKFSRKAFEEIEYLRTELFYKQNNSKVLENGAR